MFYLERWYKPCQLQVTLCLMVQYSYSKYLKVVLENNQLSFHIKHNIFSISQNHLKLLGKTKHSMFQISLVTEAKVKAYMYKSIYAIHT